MSVPPIQSGAAPSVVPSAKTFRRRGQFRESLTYYRIAGMSDVGVKVRCQRCGDQMDLRDPPPGTPWQPNQFWVCQKCGRHYWTTYPTQPGAAPAAPAGPVAPAAATAGTAAPKPAAE